MSNNYYRVAPNKCPDCQDWFKLPQGYVILRPDAERRLVGDLSAAIAGAGILVHDATFDTNMDDSILKLFVALEDKRKPINSKATELVQAALTSIGLNISRYHITETPYTRKVAVFDLEVSCG